MLIDDFVGDLDRTLAGPPGLKRDLVVEARDSLIDAADALEADGLHRAEAERLAVAEFGAVTQVAPGYQAELMAAAGRRLGLLLLIGIPITVLMWSVIWRAYPLDRIALTDEPGWYVPLSRALDITQLAMGLYGGLALLALSRGARWIRRPQAVTRSLGILVWVTLPATGLMSVSLSLTPGMEILPNFLPAVLANLATAAFWGLQVYGATRCLQITRRPAPHSRPRLPA
ncbi:permease prefix domain 1-containing protein [Nonomuraea basaltis]|uniref:permease prefix domain 1-containing protein n=1 Tax=Nonomuraea basaltis TaxID=2495887 RepID=UPI00110C4549|nr:permease prefix domain 1-containing protein [Nonomuraea basaltis]TMR97179.1 hypothetical protein EJK15_19460 [Nonomuraea basaltis]